MLGYSELETSTCASYGLLGSAAKQRRASRALRLAVGTGLGLASALVLVGLTTGGLPSSLLTRDDGPRYPQAWEQCGGSDWTGPKQCPMDHTCLVRREKFSQCVPVWLDDWLGWRTGDGAIYDDGPADDIVAHLAKPMHDSKSPPRNPGPWEQCGGKSYEGPTACPREYTCQYRRETFSQCIPQFIAKWIPSHPAHDNDDADQKVGALPPVSPAHPP